MRKLNEGIILVDNLIGFLILSSFILLVAVLLASVNKVKTELDIAHQQIIELKTCMLYECKLSTGNNVQEHCKTIEINKHKSEVCIEI